MNILILENIDMLEFQISAYINQKFEKDDVEIIYRVDQASLETLKEKISKADIICFQSILGSNSQQSLNDISLLLLRMKWFKEVRILHGGQHLTDVLNFRIDNAVKEFIKDLMGFGMTLKEIFYEAYEDMKYENSMWKRFDYYFDDVEIKIYKEIEETFFIPQRIPYIKTFRKSCYELQPYFVPKEDLSKISDILSKTSFKKEFGNHWEEFLDEIGAIFEYRIDCNEDVETEEVEEILNFSNKSLEIIKKLRKL